MDLEWHARSRLTDLYTFLPEKIDAKALDGKVPAKVLGKSKGVLHVDGYSGYNSVTVPEQRRRAGCWSHARRYFADAIKAQGKDAKPGKAHRALAFIKALYAVEHQADKEGLTPEQRYIRRQEQSQPILKELRAWLDEVQPQVPPKTALGEALTYLNNQWEALCRCFDDGRLRLDNNLTENALRPFTLGRKNWLFSDTLPGLGLRPPSIA